MKFDFYSPATTHQSIRQIGFWAFFPSASLLPVVIVIEQEVIVPPEVEVEVMQRSNASRSRKSQFRFKCHFCKFGTDGDLQEMRKHLNDIHPTWATVFLGLKRQSAGCLEDDDELLGLVFICNGFFFLIC